MRRAALLMAALLTLTVTACGGGDDGADSTTVPDGDSTSTTADSSTTMVAADAGGAVFTITDADDDARLTLAVGDEVIVQLPPGDAGDPDWGVARPFDTDVVAGGDSFRFVPSEESAGAGYWEFDFVAIGPGFTSITIGRGPTGTLDPVTFTVFVE